MNTIILSRSATGWVADFAATSKAAEIGNAIDVEIRSRKVRAEVVPLPFYRR